METNEIKLEFTPITWGVEDFDFEASDDKSIAINITRCDKSGRTIADSDWTLYAKEDCDDYWIAVAICIKSDDRRYNVGDEVKLEIYKETNVWDLEGILIDALDDEGY